MAVTLSCLGVEWPVVHDEASWAITRARYRICIAQLLCQASRERPERELIFLCVAHRLNPTHRAQHCALLLEHSSTQRAADGIHNAGARIHIHVA